jgi:hypothetical protein
MHTDVSGQPIGPLFKGQTAQLYLIECNLSQVVGTALLVKRWKKTHIKFVPAIIEKLEKCAGMGMNKQVLFLIHM